MRQAKKGDEAMTQTRIRTALMDGAIKVVARDGLDKLTTRSIANECDLHDAYIYRYFIDKEDLLKRTFLREDKILNDKILVRFDELNGTAEKSFKEILKAVLMPIWEHLMENEDICKFYVRYYYSVHFERDALEDFKEDNKRLRRVFKGILPEGSDAEMIFQYNMDTMLHLAMKVTTGEIEKTPDIDERVFKLLHSVTTVFLGIGKQ